MVPGFGDACRRRRREARCKRHLRSLFATAAFRAFEWLVRSYSFDEALGELRRAAAEKGADPWR